MRARRGFALVFALWVLVGMSTIAMAVSVIARDAVGAAQNRLSTARARWTAHGCVQSFRATAERAIWSEGFTATSIRAGWDALDKLPVPGGCLWNIQPSGLSLDVNAIGPDQLRRFFLVVGLPRDRADSLTDAIIDWRDADDRPGHLGAERAWYIENNRVPPRNGPILTLEELQHVRGITPDLIATGLGVQAHRIVWRRAHRAVLATLPGMTDEALSILEARGLADITDITAIGSFPEMSAAARDSLARASRELMPMLASAPETWIVSATAVAGTPAIRATLTNAFALGEKRLITIDQRGAP